LSARPESEQEGPGASPALLAGGFGAMLLDLLGPAVGKDGVRNYSGWYNLPPEIEARVRDLAQAQARKVGIREKIDVRL